MNDDMPKIVRMDEMLELVEALIAVVSEENATLERGLPVAMTGTLKPKIMLGRKLEHQVALVRAGVPFDPESSDAIRQRLVDRGQVLTVVMDENVLRLRAAMVSTRRRIDAVMQALREHDARPGPYSSSGRQQSTPTAPLGGRLA